MDPSRLEEKKWYWVQRSNGTIVPYRLHRVIVNGESSSSSAPGVPGQSAKVEMFVGSMIQTFNTNQVIAPAVMPQASSQDCEN